MAFAYDLIGNRLFPRIPVDIRVELESTHPTKNEVMEFVDNAIISDLSLGGAYISTPTMPPISAKVCLSFTTLDPATDKMTTIELVSRVVRYDYEESHSKGFAVEFEDMDCECEEKLLRIIASLSVAVLE